MSNILKLLSFRYSSSSALLSGLLSFPALGAFYLYFIYIIDFFGKEFSFLAWSACQPTLHLVDCTAGLKPSSGISWKNYLQSPLYLTLGLGTCACPVFGKIDLSESGF